jgi:hypothetical protein
MTNPIWNLFEWDDDNKKSGNVQHLRDHDIEPKEAEEYSFVTSAFFVTNGDLMTYTYWMEQRIGADNSD